MVDELPEFHDEISGTSQRRSGGVGASVDVGRGSQFEYTGRLFMQQEFAEGEELAYGTIHGPALRGDAADQLYDDWAGDLADLEEDWTEESQDEEAEEDEAEMVTFNDDPSLCDEDSYSTEPGEEDLGQPQVELGNSLEGDTSMNGEDTAAELLLGPEKLLLERDGECIVRKERR